jgi:hypothetical protein
LLGKLGRGALKMPTFTPPNLSTGVDQALITTSRSVAVFPIMILVFVFFVIVIGGSNAQKRRTGQADYSFWGILGSLATTFLALIFTLGEGMINLTTLGIVIAITLFIGLWFFLSKVRGE